MAIELNAMAAWEQFQGVYSMPYFVDKSGIIKKMIPLMSTPNKYVCITRPRRFGKTIMAQMLASFFSKGLIRSGVK